MSDLRWPRTLAPLLALSGVILLTARIRAAGVATVAEALASSCMLWLPLALIEVAQWLAEARAASCAHQRPLAEGLEPSLHAYLVAAIAPGGHGAGEVARALFVLRTLGVPRAVSSAFLLQAGHLMALVIIAGIVIATGSLPAEAALVLGGVTSWHAALAVLSALAWSSAPWAARLARRVGLPVPAEAAARVPTVWAGAVGWMLVARVLHLAQLTLLLGWNQPEASLTRGLAAEGLHVIAGAIGDAVPGQFGVLEGIFERYAADLSLTPASALGVVLSLRLVRAGVAGVILLGLAWRSAALPRRSTLEGPLDADR